MPIVLGTFALSSHLGAGETLFNAVFFVVVVSALAQGTTLERVAAALHLLVPPPAAASAPLSDGVLESLELVPFEVGSADAIAGVAVRELGLPRTALVAALARGKETIPPRGSTEVAAGDRLYVLVPRDLRGDLEDVFTRWRRRV